MAKSTLRDFKYGNTCAFRPIISSHIISVINHKNTVKPTAAKIIKASDAIFVGITLGNIKLYTFHKIFALEWPKSRHDSITSYINTQLKRVQVRTHSYCISSRLASEQESRSKLMVGEWQEESIFLRRCLRITTIRIWYAVMKEFTYFIELKLSTRSLSFNLPILFLQYGYLF